MFNYSGQNLTLRKYFKQPGLYLQWHVGLLPLLLLGKIDRGHRRSKFGELSCTTPKFGQAEELQIFKPNRANHVARTTTRWFTFATQFCHA